MKYDGMVLLSSVCDAQKLTDKVYIRMAFKNIYVLVKYRRGAIVDLFGGKGVAAGAIPTSIPRQVKGLVTANPHYLVGCRG